MASIMKNEPHTPSITTVMKPKKITPTPNNSMPIITHQILHDEKTIIAHITHIIAPKN